MIFVLMKLSQASDVQMEEQPEIQRRVQLETDRFMHRFHCLAQQCQVIRMGSGHQQMLETLATARITFSIGLCFLLNASLS